MGASAAAPPVRRNWTETPEATSLRRTGSAARSGSSTIAGAATFDAKIGRTKPLEERSNRSALLAPMTPENAERTALTRAAARDGASDGETGEAEVLGEG